MNKPAVVKWCILERQSSLLLDHGVEQNAEIKGFGSLPLLALGVISNSTLTLHRRTLLFGRKICMYFLRIVNSTFCPLLLH